MKKTKPNPLEVFEVRKCKFAPPYFEYIDLPMHYNLENSLSKWINNNLKKKYYLGRNVALDNANSISNVITIGFEDPKEMSYFTLACPHLIYN